MNTLAPAAAAQKGPNPQQAAQTINQRAIAATGKALPPAILQQIMQQQAQGAGSRGVDGAPVAPQLQSALNIRQQVLASAKSGKPLSPEATQAALALHRAQQAPPPGAMPPQSPPQSSPMGAAGGAAPPGGQVPPALLQQMLQHAQGGQASAPPSPNAAPPSPQQGVPAGASAAPPPPQLTPRQQPPPMSVAQGPQPGMAAFQRGASPNSAAHGQSRLTSSEMAALGRGGDSIVAHLSPGEVVIPKELMTPEIVHALQQVAGQHGLSPAQFAAGSPVAQHNPQTGAEEHSLLGTILPVAAMAVTAFFAPELIPAEWGAMAAIAGSAALVGTAGFATSMLAGNSLNQSLLMGASGLITGGMAGAAMGAGTAAAGTAAADAGTAAAPIGASMGAASPEIGASGFGSVAGNPELAGGMGGASIGSGIESAPAAGAGQAVGAFSAPTTTASTVVPPAASGAVPTSKFSLANMSNYAPFSGSANPTMAGLTLGPGITAAKGGMLAGVVGDAMGFNNPTTATTGATMPAGWNSQLPAPAINPNYGRLLGSNQTNTPTFTNYNPFQSVTGISPLTGQPAQAGYSFFPQQSATNPAIPANYAPPLAGGATINSTPNLTQILQS